MRACAYQLLTGAFGVERLYDFIKLLPGVALAVGVMLMAMPVADFLGSQILLVQGIDPTGKASPLSVVLVAILLGIVGANLFKLPTLFKAGIEFSMTKLLRLGIILVGIKLSLLDVLKLGAWGIPVVIMVIIAGLVLVSWFNKLLKLPERLGTLIAAGTSICGVTAIVSVAPAIKAEEREVTYAIANVTLFGLLGMFLYPYLEPLVLHTSEQIGLFLGTAVHETSQVVGAALTYKEVFHDEVVLKTATVTKLTRNLFLALVVPSLALLYLRRQAASRGSYAVNVRKLLPGFVLGFIAMAIVRSVGDLTFPESAAWKAFTVQIGDLWGSRYLLGMAMAAVGLGTSLKVFRGVGLKPFVVGLVGAALAGLVGLGMALLVGQFVHM